jgi:uroporphyrinogen decarboxylase
MTLRSGTVENHAVAPKNDRVLRAFRREPVDRTPVWFMRQAGRSLPEYRAIKQHYSLLEICRRPELCAEVTMQPVRRLGVDAAILYADIMHPLVGIGVDLDIVEGVGPVIAHPVRTAADTESLRPLEPVADIGFVLDGIAAVLAELGGAVPLIGFAGAPFTLASYLVEGRPSRDFLHTKRLMYGAPEVWESLMRRLVDIVATYLLAQAGAGVHALQLFDSWAGALSLDDYRRYVQPYSRAVLERVSACGLPLIHFGTSTGALLQSMAQAGGDVVGVDWRIPLDVAWERIGFDRAVQGNLDPIVLQAPWEVVQRESVAILRRAAGRPGHVFNVGHGLHPTTPPATLERLVAFLHDTPISAER